MIKIYTDGAYSSSRDQGGWAFCIEAEKPIIKYGGATKTTNNRMEIMGCLNALLYIKENNVTEDVVIFTDSMYVIGTLTKNWKMKKNTDLWPKIFDILLPNVTFEHVKGHNGDIGNSLADKWAVFASHVDGYEQDLIEE